jgi:hypothetical protein
LTSYIFPCPFFQSNYLKLFILFYLIWLFWWTIRWTNFFNFEYWNALELCFARYYRREKWILLWSSDELLSLLLKRGLFWQDNLKFCRSCSYNRSINTFIRLIQFLSLIVCLFWIVICRNKFRIVLWDWGFVCASISERQVLT